MSLRDSGPFADERINASYWQLQESVDRLYWMSRSSGRPVLPGYAGAVLRTFWTFEKR